MLFGSRTASALAAALALTSAAVAAPQIEPIKTAAITHPPPAVDKAPKETLSCPQLCEARADKALKTCLRTIAALKSDPSWISDTLTPDTCGKAAISGADQCRKQCEREAAKPIAARTD